MLALRTRFISDRVATVIFSLESCSGGGGRNDLGMMRYFPQVWASDNTDAIARLPIQYGLSYLYPTILWESCVSCTKSSDGTNDNHWKTRGHVAMMGNLGYELDLTSLLGMRRLRLLIR